jgi:hypothetical protein
VIRQRSLKDFDEDEGVAARAFDATASNDGWIDVEAPGDVYLTLSAAVRIPDPFGDRAEKACAWVKVREWCPRRMLDSCQFLCGRGGRSTLPPSARGRCGSQHEHGARGADEQRQDTTQMCSLCYSTGRAGSNGFKQRTPLRSMSLRLRVTSVMPWPSAVAASSESTAAKGSRAFILPQTCATRSSMSSTRSLVRLV